MSNRILARPFWLLAAGLLLTAAPAAAQFTPRPLSDPATGERYHIEGSAGIWSTSADMSITSESLGIVGSTIDFRTDLGLKDTKFNEVHLVLRGGKHKMRLQFIPIKFEQESILRRDITFNGQLYRIGLPVNSLLDWKAYRVGYEYDFVKKNRGFGGLLLEAKYTDVQASLASPILREYVHARAPIPAIGGIVRGYVTSNISITGELSGITIPKSQSSDFNAHYADLDIYGTVNVTNNVGAQVGYRSIDIGYTIDTDSGSFVVKGMYFGLVARY